MNVDTEAFQAFLYAEIPMVEYMQLQLHEITPRRLMASAPIAPNINDKHTVFGGSSAALMTICGWSLIKSQLEQAGLNNDVVIHQAKTHWQQAQSDDLNIRVSIGDEVDWDEVLKRVGSNKRPVRISVDCAVLNQQGETCTTMSGQFVILKRP